MLPNPNIKYQQISGGDGFATIADSTQTYLFAFSPLSGLTDIVKVLPGIEPSRVFNTLPTADLAIGDVIQRPRTLTTAPSAWPRNPTRRTSLIATSIRAGSWTLAC